MLELLTGRKPLDSSRVRSEQSLVRWATPQLHDIDALSKMVDAALNGMYPAKSLSRFADIIALCVQVLLSYFFFPFPICAFSVKKLLLHVLCSSNIHMRLAPNCDIVCSAISM
ncbi:hypothetical protein BHE74_00055679 [Ensete ventricosum]|nr:hypothetical protein BHE74_00055679 [Ensete ventricosum]